MAISKFTLNTLLSPKSGSVLNDAELVPGLGDRRLKVGYWMPDSRGHGRPRGVLAPMPFLRLQGRWLARAGFAIGSEARVVVSPRRLVIEVIDADAVSDQAAQRDLWS